MNYVEKSSRWLFCTLGLMLAAFVMAELCYSHDIPTPVDVQSSDDTPVELVVHKDLYDSDGNFVAHIHEYSISSYTQEEVDEIHENNPHTRQSVIDGLPKEGDVKGVHGRSYDTPGFSEPDNTDNIGRPDPDGEYESYGIVTLQNPNNQAESSSTQNTQGIQPSSQEIQGSQGTPPAIQTKTANYNGDPRKFEEVSAPESSDEELYVINEKNEAILATDPYQYDGTLYRLLSSSATRRNESGTRQLEIVGVVEVGSLRRLIVTLRNHTKRFIDLTQGWSLILSRPDGSTAAANMRSRGSLLITPQKARGEKYADTEVTLLPWKLVRKLDRKESFYLAFQYFYGSQSGYKPGDVFILSYEETEVSRYPEAMPFAPRLQRSVTTTWGSLKKAQ